jgi:hypothetical protein
MSVHVNHTEVESLNECVLNDIVVEILNTDLLTRNSELHLFIYIINLSHQARTYFIVIEYLHDLQLLL